MEVAETIKAVIQEIANQLGVAYNTVADFITINLPQYAQLQAMYALVPIIVVGSLFVICLIGMGISARVMIKADTEADLSIIAFAAFFVLAGIFLFALAIVIGCNLPQYIAWSNYPEAKIIDMALNAVH